MGGKESREVGREPLLSEQMQQMAIGEKKVPEDPRRVMLAGRVLTYELLGQEVANLEERLLSYDPQRPCQHFGQSPPSVAFSSKAMSDVGAVSCQALCTGRFEASLFVDS